MKFSIIIPTFNNLEYLKLCIKSIRKNSLFDHDIIIHNNGDEEPDNLIWKKINVYIRKLITMLVFAKA